METSTWEMLHDDARSYTTLAVTLLGAIAAFSQTLLGDADTLSRGLVLAAGVVLCLTIGCCVYATGTIFQGVHAGDDDCVKPVSWLHRAVLGLLVGVVLLVAGGGRTAIATDDPNSITEAPAVVAELTGDDIDTLTIVSLTQNDTTAVVTVRTAVGTTWVVHLKEGKVVRAEQAQP